MGEMQIIFKKKFELFNLFGNDFDILMICLRKKNY